MILPGSPILYLIVVVGVFVYFAFKGGGRKGHSSVIRAKTPDELHEEEYRRQDNVISLYNNNNPNCYRSEYARYIVWLYEHRDGMRPKTVEKVVEAYREKKEIMDSERKNKRLYEWWLFKHSSEYEKELALIGSK